MNSSGIEWTDRTWNPVSGCTHVSEGCRNCYAERLFPRPYPGRKFTEVRCHPERLDQPLKIRTPQRIFVNSMSDLFHEDVPFEFIDKVFAVISCSAQHTFQILTKRPARMLEYMNFDNGFGRTGYIWGAAYKIPGIKAQPGKMPPPFPYRNTWLGVSVEDQSTADERIPLLLKTPAAVRFVSVEPMLGPMELRQHLGRSCEECLHVFPRADISAERNEQQWGHACFMVIKGNRRNPGRFRCESYRLPGLDWVIVGGESGPHARPMDPHWCHDLYDQCHSAGVPFFMKQGSQANWPDFKNIQSFPTRLQVREFPQ